MTSNGRPGFFDVVNEANEAVFERLRSANDRAHRTTATLLDEAGRVQHEAIELGKTWREAPLDMPGFFNAYYDSLVRGQRRSMEVARDLAGEAREAMRENGQLARRLVSVGRESGSLVVEQARTVARQAGEQARVAAQRVGDAAGRAGDWTQRETNERTEDIDEDTKPRRRTNRSERGDTAA